MPNALVVLSGGQDSTTCLYWAKREYARVETVTFKYNQRHGREIESAKAVAAMAQVRHEVIDLGPMFHGKSPLTDSQREVHKYAGAEGLPGGLEDTFVPGRNILFLAVAANRAYVLECDHLVIGVSQEDFGGYPDCRQSFIESMESALANGLDRPIKIISPLMHLNKMKSVELAMSLPGCLEALSHTTTCYEGMFPPCGSCHSCLLRARGFNQAGIVDPLLHRGATVTG